MKKKVIIAASFAVLGVVSLTNISNSALRNGGDITLNTLFTNSSASAENSNGTCCNSLPGCCDWGGFEMDGDWV